MSKIELDKLSEEEVKNIMEDEFYLDWDNLPNRAKVGLIDVENNHNRAWTLDLYEKNRGNLNGIALFYRGTQITYERMFKQAEAYASRFKEMGVSEGTEVPICMSNSPEFVYTLLALNILGAKANCFGEFEPDYVTEIIKSCDADFIICGDDKYDKIKSSIDESGKSKILMFSLTDSLKKGEDPYYDLDKDFYDFKNRVKDYKLSDDRIMSIWNFRNIKYSQHIEIQDSIGNLNTDFLVTYTSGSTNGKRPKAIIHPNRSLITMGRAEESDMSGLPKMSNLIGLNLIPNFSNTGIISSLSDILYKGCTAALEPIYHPDFLLNCFEINKPNYAVAPRQMLVHAFKKIDMDPKYEGFKMPNMMMLTSVGEPTSKGEEKFLNSMMKRLGCGKEKLGITVPLSIGGGDCERGGMYFTPYRMLQNMNPKYWRNKYGCQLKPYPMVQLAVCDDFGRILPPGSTGYLLAKTPTIMKGYKDNIEATHSLYMVDDKGGVWTQCNVYATLGEGGTVKVHERIGREINLEDGSKLPLFVIGDVVERDTKNILSYEVVNVDNNIVVHVELMPGLKSYIKNMKTLVGIENRIMKEFGEDVAKKVVYRLRTNKEGFPFTSCLKRNYNALYSEGLDKTIKPVYTEDGQIYFISGASCFNEEKEDNKLLIKK